MGKRVTLIVVPVIGLVALTAALALVATGAIDLFPSSDEAGRLPAAPSASDQVVSVTAPPLRPPKEPSQPTPPETGGGAPPVSAGAPAIGVATPVGVVAGDEAAKRESGPAFRGVGGRPVEEPDSFARATKERGNGRGRGKAKGHEKPEHHGEAKGHTRQCLGSGVAFPHPRAAKPAHVHRPGAGKHSGRGARAHARTRR